MAVSALMNAHHSKPRIQLTVDAHALKSVQNTKSKTVNATVCAKQSAQKVKLMVKMTVNATVLRKAQETQSKMLKTAHSLAMSALLAISKTKCANALAKLALLVKSKMKRIAHAVALMSAWRVRFRMKKPACATVRLNAKAFKFKTLKTANACVKNPAQIICNTQEMDLVNVSALISAQKTCSRTKDLVYAHAMTQFVKTNCTLRMKNVSVVALPIVQLAKFKTQILAHAKQVA